MRAIVVGEKGGSRMTHELLYAAPKRSPLAPHKRKQLTLRTWLLATKRADAVQ